MPALGPGRVKVEFYDGTFWNDATTVLDLSAGVAIRPACGKTPWDQVEAGTATITLMDPTGAWWPGNPASPNSRWFGKGTPVRVTGTVGTTTSVRFVGSVRAIAASLGGDATSSARVTLTCSDVLADLAGIPMRDRLSHHLGSAAITSGGRSNGPDAWDAWPLTGAATDATIPSSRPGSANAGRVVRPLSGAGDVSFGSLEGTTAEFGPWNLPGMATLTPTGAVGPVLSLPATARTSGQTYLAFRGTSTVKMTIAAAYNGAGDNLWQLQQQAGTGELYFIDKLNNLVWATGRLVADGQWHTVVMYVNAATVPGPGQEVWCYVDGTYAGMMIYNAATLRTVVVGGLMSPKSLGKQSECYAGDVAMLGALGASQVGGIEHRAGSEPRTINDGLADVMYAAILTGVLTPSWLGPVQTSSPNVVTWPTQDTIALDALRTLAASVGARVRVEPRGTGTVSRISLMLPEDPTPALLPTPAPAFTLTLSADDADGGLSLSLPADETPTRADVTSPVASATYVGVEGLTSTSDSIATYCLTDTDAYALGGGWCYRPQGARLDQVGVDLATSSSGQPLADAVLAMIPGKTVCTLAGLPSALTGRTSQDLIVTGWDETWSAVGTTFALDTLPVDAWGRGVAASTGTDWCIVGGDTDHVATNGSTLGTGTGTLTVSSAAGINLASGATAYMDWAGEVVLGTAAYVSPGVSTLAVTARGQRGTVARAHADGERIDVYRPARAGY